MKQAVYILWWTFKIIDLESIKKCADLWRNSFEGIKRELWKKSLENMTPKVEIFSTQKQLSCALVDKSNQQSVGLGEGRGRGSGTRVSVTLQQKQKASPLSVLPAIQHKLFIHLHFISAHVMQASKQRALSHTHSNTLDLMRRKTTEHLDLYPRLLLGFTVGAGAIVFY